MKLHDLENVQKFFKAPVKINIITAPSTSNLKTCLIMLIVTQTNLFSFGVKKIPAVQNDGETNFEKSFDVSVQSSSVSVRNIL